MKEFKIFALIIVSVVFSAIYSVAQPTSETSYEISDIKLKYAKENSKLPNIDELNWLRVELKSDGGVYYSKAHDSGAKTAVNLKGFLPKSKFSASALNDMMTAVVRELNARGFDGVYVLPDKNQLDPNSGLDKRAADDKSLIFVVWVAELAEVRTVGKGDRISINDNVINSSKHSRILDNSPILSSEDGSGATMNKTEIREYIRRLNRHPNRRVDSSVAASFNPGEMNFDYLINEHKSWMVYSQMSNTGTSVTGKNRYRFGFVDYQLSGNDDILALDYIESFKSTRAGMLSYQIPILYPDYLKFRAFMSASDYSARDVGNSLLDYSGSNYIGGGEFIASPFDIGANIALDFIAGFRYESLSVNNETFNQRGDASLYIPYIGVSAERRNALYNTRFSLFAETNLGNVSEYDKRGLGRLNTDSNYVVLRGDFVQSFFIEPLILGEKFFDTSDWTNSIYANEFYFRIRGNWTPGDKRLIPQQEFVGGGFYSVRGYPESIAAGDNGFVINAEYRLHLSRLFAPYSALSEESGKDRMFNNFNMRAPSSLSLADWNLMFRVFFDYAKITNNNRMFYESNLELMSAGVGLECQIMSNLSARVDWGYVLKGLTQYNTPVKDAQVGDSRVSFSITLSY